MDTVLIIGATSDICRSLAEQFARQGVHLILAGRDQSELERNQRDLAVRYDIDIHTVVVDAADTASHSSFFQSCVDYTLQRLHQLDGVVIGYGSLGDQQSAEHSFLEAERIIHMNYTSYVSLLLLAADHLTALQHGFICAIGSVAGDRGRKSNYIYGSAKSGLETFLQGLRHRLASAKVRVLTVKPGFVDTKMTYGIIKPSPMVASPEQVAMSIVKAIQHKKSTVYAPGFWRWIMLIIRMIPEPLFKRTNL